MRASRKSYTSLSRVRLLEAWGLAQGDGEVEETQQFGVLRVGLCHLPREVMC